MRYYFLLLLVAFLLASCSGKKRIPGNIIPIEKMHLVLWDVMKADEYIIYQSSQDSSLHKETETVKLYKQILDSHNITEEEFKKSMNFYQNHPDILKIILDSVQKKADRVNIPPASTVPVD